MWTRKELKAKARKAVKEHYWQCVLAGVIFAMSSNMGSYILYYKDNHPELPAWQVLLITMGALFVALFIAYPLIVGGTKLFINIVEEKGEFSDVLFAYKENLGNVIFNMFMMRLQIMLWSLLLIVPGVIKAYEYRMIPYLLAENSDMLKKDIFAESKKMMDGQKKNMFLLDLSFIGWYLVSMVTFGIAGVFFVSPYIEMTYAQFYKTMKAEKQVTLI